MSGIGSANWVQDFVGVPYQLLGRDVRGLDCWGLVSCVYRKRLGISLPDWMDGSDIDFNAEGNWGEIGEPVDMCLVRSTRGGILPDHWGVYVAGGVLSAEAPFSTFVELRRFQDINPDTRFGVYCFEESKVS